MGLALLLLLVSSLPQSLVSMFPPRAGARLAGGLGSLTRLLEQGGMVAVAALVLRRAAMLSLNIALCRWHQRVACGGVARAGWVVLAAVVLHGVCEAGLNVGGLTTTAPLAALAASVGVSLVALAVWAWPRGGLVARSEVL